MAWNRTLVYARTSCNSCSFSFIWNQASCHNRPTSLSWRSQMLLCTLSCGWVQTGVPPCTVWFRQKSRTWPAVLFQFMLFDSPLHSQNCTLCLGPSHSRMLSENTGTCSWRSDFVKTRKNFRKCHFKWVFTEVWFQHQTCAVNICAYQIKVCRKCRLFPHITGKWPDWPYNQRPKYMRLLWCKLRMPLFGRFVVTPPSALESSPSNPESAVWNLPTVCWEEPVNSSLDKCKQTIRIIFDIAGIHSRIYFCKPVTQVWKHNLGLQLLRRNHTELYSVQKTLQHTASQVLHPAFSVILRFLRVYSTAVLHSRFKKTSQRRMCTKGGRRILRCQSPSQLKQSWLESIQQRDSKSRRAAWVANARDGCATKWQLQCVPVIASPLDMHRTHLSIVLCYGYWHDPTRLGTLSFQKKLHVVCHIKVLVPWRGDKVTIRWWNLNFEPVEYIHLISMAQWKGSPYTYVRKLESRPQYLTEENRAKLISIVAGRGDFLNWHSLSIFSAHLFVLVANL